MSTEKHIAHRIATIDQLFKQYVSITGKTLISSKIRTRKYKIFKQFNGMSPNSIYLKIDQGKTRWVVSSGKIKLLRRKLFIHKTVAVIYKYGQLLVDVEKKETSLLLDALQAVVDDISRKIKKII